MKPLNTILPFACILIVGCSTPILNTTDKPPENDQSSIGIPYYLPKTLIPVTVIASKKPIAAASVATADGSTQMSNTNNLNVTINNKPDSTKDAAAKQPDNKEQMHYKVTIGTPISVPDYRTTYFLNYLPEVATEDDVTLSVTETGLLQTANVVVKDQSAEIIKKLTDLAVDIAKAVTVLGLPTLPVGPPNGRSDVPSAIEHSPPDWECEDRKEFSLETFIDPGYINAQYVQSIVPQASKLQSDASSTDTQLPGEKTPPIDSMHEVMFSYQAVNAFLSLQKAPIQLGIARMLDSDSAISQLPTMCASSDEATPESNCIVGGLIFRTSDEYILSVEIDDALSPYAKQSSTGKPLDQLNCMATSSVRKEIRFSAPNLARAFDLDVERSALVQKEMNIVVKDGTLLGTHIKKPSELLGGVTLPVEVVERLLDIPSALLTLRIKNLTEQGTLTQREAELIKAEIARIRQLEELRALQNSQPPTTP